MRKKLKTFRVLIWGLSILISFCLAYPQYDNAGEIRFLSRHLIFKSLEIADQEDLGVDLLGPAKGIVLTSFPNPGHLGIHPFKDSFSFPFHSFSIEQKISILRC